MVLFPKYFMEGREFESRHPDQQNQAAIYGCFFYLTRPLKISLCSDQIKR